MKTVIISLGGSLIVPDKIDIPFLQQFKALINTYLAKNDARLVIVCGGGRIARQYQEAAQQLGATSFADLDWIGIGATRINAELVKAVFGSSAFPRIVYNPKEKISTTKKVIIAAGYEPGCSTDMDAVLLAKNLHAAFVVNLSNIDGVYDKDPLKNKNAKRFEKMLWKELRALVGDSWKPGMNTPFDPVAAREAEKLGLTVIVANGKDVSNLDKILSGKKFVGTVIGGLF